MQKIELLAPAKDFKGGCIAIDYGADALYIGGAKFGARYAAANSIEDIGRLVAYANQYGVRVYTTLNTILYESELEQARKCAQELIDVGVSALIIQDMAYMRMGLSGVEFHASTQTACADSDKVNFFANSGFSRAILERGLSGHRIADICSQSNLDIECFIHGAICVGNSGECYMSRSCGSRSGNRGECTQPCRLPYDLLDDKGNTLLSDKYILSVKDMNLSTRLGDMLQAGVSSFKIEGRLKDMHYVKNVVGYYRKELDEIFAKNQNKYCRSSIGVTKIDFTPNVEKCFTRGGSTYFYDEKQSGVCTYDTPKAVGEKLGVVSASGKDWLEIRGLQSKLNSADGICVVSSSGLVGSNINKVEGSKIHLNRGEYFPKDGIVYRNHDHKFVQQVESSQTRRVVRAKVDVVLESCKSIKIRITDEGGLSAEREFFGEFEVAKNIDRAKDTFLKQLSKSGDTIFEVVDVSLECNGDFPFIPISQINMQRRYILDSLQDLRQSIRPVLELAVEIVDYPYPMSRLDGVGNVTNSLARAFYRDHGVESISDGLDLKESLNGEVVMTTPYCIRREMGECLKEKTKLRGELRLRSGDNIYLLKFDCNRCEMQIIKEPI